MVGAEIRLQRQLSRTTRQAVSRQIGPASRRLAETPSAADNEAIRRVGVKPGAVIFESARLHRASLLQRWPAFGLIRAVSPLTAMVAASETLGVPEWARLTDTQIAALLNAADKILQIELRGIAPNRRATVFLRSQEPPVAISTTTIDQFTQSTLGYSPEDPAVISAIADRYGENAVRPLSLTDIEHLHEAVAVTPFAAVSMNGEMMGEWIQPRS